MLTSSVLPARESSQRFCRTATAIRRQAHDFTIEGVEVAPDSAADGTGSGGGYTSAFISLGQGGSAQDDTSLVPYNIVVDRSYIHGWDDLGVDSTTGIGGVANSDLAANYDVGVSLGSNYTTISNDYISDIHAWSIEAHGVSGSNGLGNYTINNNYIEATGENFIYGGATCYIPDVTATNITFTHNYLFKRLAWDQFDPNYVPFYDSNGIEETMDVKNLFELKRGINVLVDSNLMENCWVGADQVAEAVAIQPKNDGSGSPWTIIAYVTITNNVFRNTGKGVGVAMDGLTTMGNYGRSFHA